MAKRIQESISMQKEKENDTPPGILIQEYNSLVSLYTHSENTLFSIFNFYVTLLTTITGAIVVVFQLSEKNADSPFGTILVLLVFIVLIGIITQDALIHKNCDLAHFALAINSIKSHLLKKHPDAQQYVFYMWDLHVRVNPLKYKITLDEKIDKYLWWMLPIGMQQLFVSLMNSFALGLFVIMLVAVYGDLQLNLLKLFIAIPFVIVFSFVAQCTYANVKFNHRIRRSAIAMNGQLQEWIGSR
ncbi:MAG: hypothetical protein HYZ25_19630 [Chloroflexi bacterium]|nr:hypothetical protein [Chloroflexota bacterium]